jgi:penicillin-binding protein 1A
MQVARNFFLSSEKTSAASSTRPCSPSRSSTTSKDEILELYINQIYLGQRAYGFAAAAQIYFGKPLEG